MTREEKVKNLLTELIDMIDNGSQRDLDKADEIGTSIIKLLEQEPILDKIRDEIEQEYKVESEHPYGQGLRRALEIIDKYREPQESEPGMSEEISREEIAALLARESEEQT